jgi:hypothetical protein
MNCIQSATEILQSFVRCVCPLAEANHATRVWIWIPLNRFAGRSSRIREGLGLV